MAIWGCSIESHCVPINSGILYHKMAPLTGVTFVLRFIALYKVQATTFLNTSANNNYPYIFRMPADVFFAYQADK